MAVTTMATTEHTAGIMPSVNDLLAAVVILAVYLIRIGYLAEGLPTPFALALVTDALLPLFAGAWVFLSAVYVVVDGRR